jgi:hypothetical protein
MKQYTLHRKTRINWAGITWLLLLVISIIFFFIAIGFIAFPPKYILPLGVIIALIDILMGFFSLRKIRLKKGFKKKSIKKFFTIIIGSSSTLVGNRNDE